MVLLVIIRILLGGIFLISAASKIISPKLFVYNVKQYDILPPSIATMFGWSLPFLELLVGISFLLGFYSYWGAVLTIVMLISFLIAQVIVIARHQNLSCSCFGLLYREKIGLSTVCRDIILIIMATYIAIIDSGSYTVLYFIRNLNLGSLFVLIFTGIMFLVSLFIALYSVKPRSVINVFQKFSITTSK